MANLNRYDSMEDLIKNSEENLDLKQISQLILNYLDSKKAEDIVLYTFPEYKINYEIIVTCIATSSRHASSLAENLMHHLKENGINSGASGLNDPDWVVVFGQDLFAVHILTENGENYFKLNDLFESRKIGEIK